MLTNVGEGMVSGISGVEWDAVEQPSQFLEYWVLEEKTLSSMAYAPTQHPHPNRPPTRCPGALASSR